MVAMVVIASIIVVTILSLVIALVVANSESETATTTSGSINQEESSHNSVIDMENSSIFGGGGGTVLERTICALLFLALALLILKKAFPNWFKSLASCCIKQPVSPTIPPTTEPTNIATSDPVSSPPTVKYLPSRKTQPHLDFVLDEDMDATDEDLYTAYKMHKDDEDFRRMRQIQRRRALFRNLTEEEDDHKYFKRIEGGISARKTGKMRREIKDGSGPQKTQSLCFPKPRFSEIDDKDGNEEDGDFDELDEELNEVGGSWPN